MKEIIWSKRLNPTSNTNLAQKIEIEEEKEEMPCEPKKKYIPLDMHQKRNHHHPKKKARSAGSIVPGPTSREIALSCDVTTVAKKATSKRNVGNMNCTSRSKNKKGE